MLTVAEAQQRITAAFRPLGSETVALVNLVGRVATRNLCATSDQPPLPVSAMDGYAVRLADGEAPRKVIGTAPAGHPFRGAVGAGEAVRIFTGGVVPTGADAIVIQEEVDLAGGNVHFNVSALRPDYIRAAGQDFKNGDVLALAGKHITPRDLALLAAGDIAGAEVWRRPRIAIASIGDELSSPGEPRRPGGIVASSGFGLAAMIARWGGVPYDLGIVADNAEQIAAIAAADADVIVTLGGASVGDHDLVRAALGTTDFELDFWKVAMRPGKPLLFGRLGARPLLGMPGNPVSALVCAILFLKPAIDAMLGIEEALPAQAARLKRALPANDTRQDYIRARLIHDGGEVWADPFAQQDSAMLSVLAKADALIVRAPNAGAAEPGDRVEIIPLGAI
jgi:molybdopterin molybdotransferase